MFYKDISFEKKIKFFMHVSCNFREWLKINLTKKSRFFNQMVEVNFQMVKLQNIYMSVESYTKCLILELHNKMELLNINIDISLNLG